MRMMTMLDEGGTLFRSFYLALPHRDPFTVMPKTPLGNKKQ